jgi:hypothetical protein
LPVLVTTNVWLESRLTVTVPKSNVAPSEIATAGEGLGQVGTGCVLQSRTPVACSVTCVDCSARSLASRNLTVIFWDACEASTGE